MKVQVERKTGDTWRQVRVDVHASRNDNIWFKLEGAIYVLKDLREGTEVVTKTAKGWQKAGRVTRGTIFLGPDTDKSFSETMEEQARQNPVCTKPLFP